MFLSYKCIMFNNKEKLISLLKKNEPILLDDKDNWKLTNLVFDKIVSNSNQRNSNHFFLSLNENYGPIEKNIFLTKFLPLILGFGESKNNFSLRKPLVILCLPRSGSTFLYKIFKDNNISDPGEKLTYKFLEFINSNYHVYECCINLIKKNHKNFSIKWLVNFTELVFSFAPFKIRVGMAKILRESNVLILRRDLYDLTVSNLIAKKSKIYHKWKDHDDKEYHSLIENLSFSDDELISEFNYNLNADKRLMKFSKFLSSKYFLEFEDMKNNPIKEFIKILNWMNTPIPKKIIIPNLKPTKSKLNDFLSDRIKSLI